VCSTTDQWLKRRYDRKSFQVEFKLVRGYDDVIKKMILGLVNIYHRSNKVDTGIQSQIVFVPYHFGDRHERKARKVLINIIPHT
jgi:hypothetical protein